ncbi:hypothetical protein F3J19_31550, partial [Burkholderia sp. Ax-1724]|nr:hypothetical protein [Burkholderia sp. Ax-1724]
CRLPVAGCRLPVAGCRLPVAGCRLPVAGCRLPVAGCRLPVAGCRQSLRCREVPCEKSAPEHAPACFYAARAPRHRGLMPAA